MHTNKLLFIKSLDLKHLGLLEILFAMFPILAPYAIGPIPYSVAGVLLMDILAYNRSRKIQRGQYKTFRYFLYFYIIHEIWLVCVLSGNAPSFINSTISNLINIISIPLICSSLNTQKLRGALNLVAIISIIGMVYHVTLTLTGSIVHTIPMPFLSPHESADVAFRDMDRPCSFYSEPQAYVTYMLVPLIWSLIDKNYVWAGIITFTLLLSTSTTGLVLAFLVLAIYAISQGVNKKIYVLFIFAMIGLAYAYTHLSIFESGLDKAENYDLENSTRMAQGPKIVLNMDPMYMVFGIPYANAYEYYKAGKIGNDLVVLYGNNIYMATTWLLILRFGFIGLFMYANIYIDVIRKYRHAIPYAVVLLATMFSNPDFLGAAFTFTGIALMSLAYNYKPQVK